MRQDKENNNAEAVSISVGSRAAPCPAEPTSCEKQSKGETSSRPVYVSCPACHTGYKCYFRTDIIAGVKDGIARVLVTPPCGHKFVVFVDGNPRARGIERIDHEGVVCEHADTTFLEYHVKALEAKHQLLAKANNGYNEAFDLLQQIKKAKKELVMLKSKIVVK